MNKFKFKYSLTVWILLALVTVILAVGLALNVFNLVQYLPFGAFKIVVNAVIVILNTFLFVFVLSVIFYGRYVIKNGRVYTCFGFLSAKVNVSDIVQLTHFKKSDKLVVYFKDAKYSVIVISPADYEPFILAIRELNPHVVYSTEIDGEDTPD